MRTGTEPGPKRQRGRTSRLLHGLSTASQSPLAAITAAFVSGGFLIAALVSTRPTALLTAFEAVAAAVTLVMVFVLQHTQARQQAAFHRKLDEILRVVPGADPRLVRVESAPDAELSQAADRHNEVREHALREASGTGR